MNLHHNKLLNKLFIKLYFFQPFSSPKKNPRSQKTTRQKIFERKSRANFKSDTYDCGNKTCFLEHIMLPDCYIYLHTNRTSCDIPCQLDGCDRELHHFISCPVWICNPKTTTTTTTTATTTTKTTTTTTTDTSSTTTKTTTSTTTRTTTKTTLSTTHPTTPVTTTRTTTTAPFPIDHPGILYSSLCLNIFLALILLFVGYLKCKKAILRSIRAFRNRHTNAEPPIIRSSQNYFAVADSSSEDFDTNENNPLLGTGRRSRSPHVPSFLNTPVGTPSERSRNIPCPRIPSFQNSQASPNASFLLNANLSDVLTDLPTNRPRPKLTRHETRPRETPKTDSRNTLSHSRNTLSHSRNTLSQSPMENYDMKTFKSKPSPPKRTSSLKETFF